MHKLQISAAAMVLFALALGPAHAQSPPNDSQSQNTAPAQPSPFLLEPEFKVKGDEIKSQTYRSQPAGQNQNWNLDIGRFQPKFEDDPNKLAPDLEGNYSGMRLRLPLRGGLGN